MCGGRGTIFEYLKRSLLKVEERDADFENSLDILLRHDQTKVKKSQRVLNEVFFTLLMMKRNDSLMFVLSEVAKVINRGHEKE